MITIALKHIINTALLIFLSTVLSSGNAATIIYTQNFENPIGFGNPAGDVSQISVNTLYRNQPSGFDFSQRNTVETLFIRGTRAFGHGYSDPTGIGGKYALGMLERVQNDLLGLSFNIGSNSFLNFSLDISSIDISVLAGPFTRPGAIPVFEFTLFDNPLGLAGLGTGEILDIQRATATPSERDVFSWTNAIIALNADDSTNGNVTLRIDLVAGGYAAMDNFIVAVSNKPGDISEPHEVPEPSIFYLLAGSLVVLYGVQRKRMAT